MADISQIKLPDNTIYDIKDPIARTSIPFGQVDSTSTSTVFTAQVSGITEYYDGLTVLLKNGVVTSASGFTININGLGPKPSYSNMATGNDITPTAPTRDTTIFNINYTMLFIYSSDIVSGGGWIMYRGYDANTNTLGYQLRTNSTARTASDTTGRYRLMFTSADGTQWVPSNNSTSTNSTSARTVNQRPIDPFGDIIYYGYTTVYQPNAAISAAYQWQQYTLGIGYSFNRTGAAQSMAYPAPVYVKCAPQSDGSAIIDADTPYVQALPSSEDGKIYIYLGDAYSATAVELRMNHPVYYYTDGGIRLWSGVNAASKSYVDTAISSIAIPSKVSELTNDAGYISSYTETDPTVPSWAKASVKPTYTYDEVGALPSNTTYVSTVNGQSGAVTIPDASAYILTYGGTVTFSEVLAAYNAGRPIYVKHTDPEEGDLLYSPVTLVINETNYYGFDCVNDTRLWEHLGTYTVGDYGTIHWNSTTGWSVDSVSVQIPTTYVRDVQDNSGTSIVSNGIATLPQIPTPTPQTTWYGWCSTLSTTAEKAVTCEGFTLVTGAIIGVYFDKGSNLAAPTLNVNSTGAKDIYVGSAVTNSTTNVLNWANDTIIYFIYDGIRYRYMTSTSSAAANASRGASTWYAICNAAATDITKEVLVQNYVLTKGSLIVIYFSNGNTSTSAISLNINSTGAKKVKVNGLATSSKNLLWSAGARLTFMYDGTDYQLISIASDSIPQRYNSSTNPNGYLTLADLPIYDGSVS